MTVACDVASKRKTPALKLLSLLLLKCTTLDILTIHVILLICNTTAQFLGTLKGNESPKVKEGLAVKDKIIL